MITSIEINGNKMIGGLIPSTTEVILDVPVISDGTSKTFSYTAPASGFYIVEFVANNYNGSNFGCISYNITRHLKYSDTLDNQFKGVNHTIPALKGDSIDIWFQNHVKVKYFRFIYAIGSEPK